jgi:ferredoxin-type protein NapH
VSSGARRLKANRFKRLGGYALGLALFYAPFALLIKLVAALTPASPAGTSVSDVHTACLRMPLGWLVQPWMWPSLAGNPISWLPILVLPLGAVLAGPLFCGWLCPAGALPEYLGRLVPDRLKFDFKGRVEIVPLRYGFFVGFLFAPFISTSICCSFCNFTHMQNIVSAVTGDIAGLTYFTSMGILAATMWIVPLGLFTKGGRGWCLFLCPAGTTMAMASGLTSRFGGLWRVRARSHTCVSCGSCADVCPMRAIDVDPEKGTRIEQHLCISCLDCVKACSSGSITYGRES